MLAEAEDSAAGATESAMGRWGKKVLQRIFGGKQAGEALPVVVAEAIDNPGDEDYLNQLKLAIRKAMAADAQLAKDVGSILAEATQSPPADRGGVPQHITASDGTVLAPAESAGHTYYVSLGDMTINLATTKPERAMAAEPAEVPTQQQGQADRDGPGSGAGESASDGDA